MALPKAKDGITTRSTQASLVLPELPLQLTGFPGCQPLAAPSRRSPYREQLSLMLAKTDGDLAGMRPGLRSRRTSMLLLSYPADIVLGMKSTEVANTMSSTITALGLRTERDSIALVV